MARLSRYSRWDGTQAVPDLDADQLRRVLGLVRVLGEHRRDRLADVAHALRRQHRSSPRMAGGLRAGSGGVIEAAAAMRWRLMLARACAWSLLVAGWIGIGSFALLVAPSLSAGFALVALWLLGLGGAPEFDACEQCRGNAPISMLTSGCPANVRTSEADEQRRAFRRGVEFFCIFAI